MSVQYVLKRAGQKMGLNPSDANQREVLLGFLNEAANELYTQCDMPGCLLEQVFKVNGDQTIALPSYVGNIRAVREYASMVPWHINQMRPRYNVSNWNDFWRGVRLKGKFATETSLSNTAPLGISVAAVETPNVVVTVTGKTTESESITETITLDSTYKLTVNNFIEITGFNKDRVNEYNVALADADGLVLSVINNNELTATYQVLDVSTCPWLPQSQSKTEHYLEILFKKRLGWFSNDGDEFPAQGYDDIWVNKVMQLYHEEQGNAALAAAFDQKATRSLARKIQEENRATEDIVSITENPHDSLCPRVRSRRPYVYGGFSTTSRYGSL